MPAHALSCNGNPDTRTPHIDLLAKTGVNFTKAVSGFPLCCPYRGSMLTGLYPHECVPGHEYPLPPEKTTVADVFNEHGYHTAYIGKWHLDGFQEREGRAAFHVVSRERRGRFQYWLGYENNNSQYDCYVHGGMPEIPPTRLNGYETDALTGLFIEHLNTLPDEKPFFAVLSVQPPHDPYAAPPEYMRRHTPASISLRKNVPDVGWVTEKARDELSGAYAMAENLDDNVGKVVKWLRDTGKYENTHILFFSDHGDMHGSHGRFRKTIAYEESVRVPFIIGGGLPHYEGWRTGKTSCLINHVDIAPTSLGLCGINPPESMRGTNYAGLRKSGAGLPLYPESAYLQSVIPTRHPDSEEFAWRGVVTADGYKYASFERMPWLMFDLNTDPYEQVNLAHNREFKEKRDELQQRLRQWIDDTGDSFEL